MAVAGERPRLSPGSSRWIRTRSLLSAVMSLAPSSQYHVARPRRATPPDGKGLTSSRRAGSQRSYVSRRLSRRDRLAQGVDEGGAGE